MLIAGVNKLTFDWNKAKVWCSNAKTKLLFNTNKTDIDAVSAQWKSEHLKFSITPCIQHQSTDRSMLNVEKNKAAISPACSPHCEYVANYVRLIPAAIQTLKQSLARSWYCIPRSKNFLPTNMLHGQNRGMYTSRLQYTSSKLRL